MNIRGRLTLRFGLIVASILLFLSLLIYYFSSSHRESEFYGRLKNRGITTAKILVDAKAVDSTLLQVIDRNTRNMLFDEDVTIYNYKNQVIYNYSKDSASILYAPAFLNKIRLEKEIRLHSDEKETIGFLYEGKYDHFVVVVTAIDRIGLSAMNNLKIILLFGFLLSVGITFFAGWFYSGDALKPIAKIISEADQITASKLNLRINEGNKTDELGRLAITFNNMLNRLEKAFVMQRSFVSNASHELRTPLTSMTGQVEVAMFKKRSETEYNDILISLLEDMKNMTKLSNNLLDLARASADVSFLKLETIRIDEQLFLAREELLKKESLYIINISFNEDFPKEEEKLTLLGNDQLLKSAFLNLMENACKYSQNNTVDILFQYQNRQISIDFLDEGIGIPREDIANILQPFYRASNARNKTGHGLGLSLTEKIIELHKGKLEIISELNKGTVIKVSLPTLA